MVLLLLISFALKSNQIEQKSTWEAGAFFVPFKEEEQGRKKAICSAVFCSARRFVCSPNSIKKCVVFRVAKWSKWWRLIGALLHSTSWMRKRRTRTREELAKLWLLTQVALSITHTRRWRWKMGQSRSGRSKEKRVALCVCVCAEVDLVANRILSVKKRQEEKKAPLAWARSSNKLIRCDRRNNNTKGATNLEHKR